MTARVLRVKGAVCCYRKVLFVSQPSSTFDSTTSVPKSGQLTQPLTYVLLLSYNFSIFGRYQQCLILCGSRGHQWVSLSLSRATTLRTGRLMPLRQDHHQYKSRPTMHLLGHRHPISSTNLQITPQHSEEMHTLHPQVLRQGGRRKLMKVLGPGLMLMKNLRHISTYHWHPYFSFQDQTSGLELMSRELSNNVITSYT